LPTEDSPPSAARPRSRAAARLALAAAAGVAALLLIGGGSAQAAPCPGASDPSCSFSAAWGNTSAIGEQGEGILRQPEAVDLDGSSILVGDRWSWHVQAFGVGDHAWASQWGEYGSGGGQFTAVGGVAHDSSGNIYVLDIANNRVEKFDASHNLLAQWGGRGTGNGGPADFNINFKGGVAVDGSSYVYVSDTYNHRVVKFDTAGHYVGQIGTTGVAGTGSGQFQYPQGLTVDSAHNLYVADDQNDRIQKFDRNGTHLATIGSSAQMNHPYDVGVDAGGNVYVADNLNHRVDKFAPSGAFVKSWGGKGTAVGQLQTPRAIAVDGAGHNYVADTNNERMQEFDANGNVVTTSGPNPWGANGRAGGNLSGPEGLDASSGKLAIADTLEYWIQELSPSDGGFIAKFGGHGTGPGQFELPADVAVDSSGTIDVADTGNDRVQQLDSTGAYIREAGGFSLPQGVAVDAASDFYVADTGNNRVQKLSPAGALLGTWSSFNGGDTFSGAEDVALSPGGDLYVADTGHSRIVELDASGNYVRSWVVSGAGPSQPSGIAVDAAGNVYVADRGNAAVQEYSPTGTFLLKWGARGHGAGEFWTGGPQDVATDAAGNVYASDTYDNRVEKFAFGASPSPSQPPAVNTGSTSAVSKTSATLAGTINPEGQTTSWHFDYGTTTAYGAGSPQGSLPAVTTDQAVSTTLSGLRSGTTYHYRLVATNAAGTSYGLDRTFRTAGRSRR
jgi:sugar lactone lactonase YvrE